MNAPSGPPDDAVFLPEGQEMDGPLTQAIIGERTWMSVIGPDGMIGSAATREVLNTALANLGRPVG
jgi:hypothetical protein